MHRTQISLEPWQYEALKALAERRGMSLAAVIRETVSEKLKPSSPSSHPSSPLDEIAGIADGPAGLTEEDQDRTIYDPHKEGLGDGPEESPDSEPSS